MNALWIALFVLLSQAPQSTASIQGTVMRPSGEGPISGARVELIRVDGSSPQSYAGVSSPDGDFFIPNVRPGVYRLAASRTGYLKREFGQRSRYGTGLVMNLQAGQQIRNVAIELRPAAAISGRVMDTQGDPAAAVEVKAMISVYQQEQRILRTVQSAITNELGEYRLFGLAPGQYFVSATPRGDLPVMTLVVGPTATLPTRQELLAGSFAAVYYPSTTDSRISTPIDVNGGGEFSGVNITLVPSRLHHIRGTVIGGSARVTLVPRDPGLTTSVLRADAIEGPFDLRNVGPGEYSLVARSGELLGIVPVDVRDSDVEGITIGLSPTVPVPTRVSFEDRVPGENDPELETVNLTLLAVPPIPGADDPDVYSPFPNGFLAFGVLLRQEFRVTNLKIQNPNPAARLQNAYIKSIRMGNRDVLNDGLRVDDPADIVGSIEIVIGTRTGTLTGTVVNEKQKPGENVTVLLVPDGGRRRWADAYRTATTDIAGRYIIDRIPPGDYIVFSWEEIEDGAWMDPELMKKYEERGKRIHISENASQTLNIYGNTVSFKEIANCENQPSDSHMHCHYCAHNANCRASLFLCGVRFE